MERTRERISTSHSGKQDGCRVLSRRLARHVVDAAPILHRRAISRLLA